MRGLTLLLLSTMNSMLFLVVNLRYPSQCLSAISQISRRCSTLMSRHAAHANGIDFIAALGHVNKHARLQDFMVEPLAEIVLDDGRKEVPEISRSYISNPIL